MRLGRLLLVFTLFIIIIPGGFSAVVKGALYDKDFNEKLVENVLIMDKEKKIGIAPFAKHIQKQYPINKTEELIQKLVKDNYKIFLFGGGKEEKQIAEKISKEIPNVTSLIGKFSLKDEIAFIDKLDVMITPDSGNMHIAALTSVRIISIWGATHPYAGFTPNVPENNLYIIQNNNFCIQWFTNFRDLLWCRCSCIA